MSESRGCYVCVSSGRSGRLDDCKPLMFVGSKRSGTSILVRLLNLDPRIFVAPEADIIWLLYQLSTNDTAIRPHPRDGPVGLARTWERTHDVRRRLAERYVDIRQAYWDALERYLEDERPGGAVPFIVGDKKPVQQCDPLLRPFVEQHWPDSLYVHMVRHPAAVVRSMVTASTTWASGVPPYWRLSQQALAEYWAEHEEWVLELKQRCPVHTLRLEDLVSRPERTLTDLCGFMGGDGYCDLDAVRGLLHQGPLQPCAPLAAQSKRVSRIMEMYGYAW